MVGSIQLDQQKTLSITDVETAIQRRSIVDLLHAELPGFIENTTLSMESTDTSELNEKLYDTMKSEFMSTQPGKSAKKWGIHNNGICFLISLCVEALTDDL